MGDVVLCRTVAVVAVVLLTAAVPFLIGVVVAARADRGARQARLWRHRWQVVMVHPGAGVTVFCSHRWEFTADLCADWRDRKYAFAKTPELWEFHEARRTPRR